jgi:transposase
MKDYFICIDVGKNNHWANVMTPDGEILVDPFPFSNDDKGYKKFYKAVTPYLSKNHLVGMEDTDHYGYNLIDSLFEHHATVSMINPISTDAMCKASLKSTKTDKEDTKLIGSVLLNPKLYRILEVHTAQVTEMRELTRYHHTMQETATRYKEQLQKSLDLVFPELNTIFSSKYAPTCIRLLETYQSAESIAHADIRTLRNILKPKGLRGKTVSFSVEQLKQLAKNSVGHSNMILEMEIRHLVQIIKDIDSNLEEVDKKIEEYSISLNSPILQIPGISHFSCVSILTELGDINNFSDPRQITSFAGVNPIVYQSGQFNASMTRISKTGSKYLRKTLYQIILPVIRFNPTFKSYYDKKISEGKSFRCAEGHCVRKLIRVIYHIQSTGEQFSPELLR